ncbi:MAG TPA: hypothetical protein VI299_00510 [Polyangiales bacterium]
MRAIWLCAALTACSATPSASSSVDDEGAEDPRASLDASTATAECLDEGSSRACTCDNGGTGRKTCRKGQYGSCLDCSEPAASRDGSVRPVAQELCKAGYYVGHMEGDYKPGFASLGIAQSGFEVQFKSESMNGQPPLALTLVEKTQGVGEFSSFTVNGGCMQGMARSMGTDNPFTARLTGELDCATGDFTGTMEGIYTLLSLPGLDYDFKGPITAHFVNGELADGEWSAREPNALNGQPAGGGTGTWGASWTADAAPDAGVDPCAKLMLDTP